MKKPFITIVLLILACSGFTQKGSGTGLGLSLSYDIIAKEYNGTIRVESRESWGCMFVIQLIA